MTPPQGHVWIRQVEHPQSCHGPPEDTEARKARKANGHAVMGRHVVSGGWGKPPDPGGHRFGSGGQSTRGLAEKFKKAQTGDIATFPRKIAGFGPPWALPQKRQWPEP